MLWVFPCSFFGSFFHFFLLRSGRRFLRALQSLVLFVLQIRFLGIFEFSKFVLLSGVRVKLVQGKSHNTIKDETRNPKFLETFETHLL